MYVCVCVCVCILCVSVYLLPCGALAIFCLELCLSAAPDTAPFLPPLPRVCEKRRVNETHELLTNTATNFVGACQWEKQIYGIM